MLLLRADLTLESPKTGSQGDRSGARVEAPLAVDDVAGHRRFQGFGFPIDGGDLGCTTRFEYEQMLDQGGVDIAQPDISMAGGVTEVLRIARMAGARGKRLVPHGYKTNILIAANLAFLAQHEDEESSNIPPATRGCAGN